MTGDLLCPVTGKRCRHAGLNYTPVRIKVFRRVGALEVPNGEEVQLQVDTRGIFCNNEGRYARDLQACPITPTHITTTYQLQGQQKIGKWLS